MTEVEVEWTERVAAWRTSGETAEQFAERIGFAAGTLRWWSSRLGKPTPMAKPPALARVEVRSRPRPTPKSSLQLDVAGVRIIVEIGFDASLLRSVVAALTSQEAR